MADFILSGVDDKVLITVCCGAIIFVIAGLLTLSRFQNSISTPRTRVNTEEYSYEDRRIQHRSYNNDCCPICLSVHRLAVETNCGHIFCGSCLRNYLSRTRGDFSLFGNQASCPLCRQNINILLLNFSQEDSLSIDLEDERRNVERTVHEYNVRFGEGPRDFWSYIRDCPVLIRHMFFDFFTFGGLVWLFRLRVILCCLGAVIYFFNPLDIIPEAMFGIFGFLDDVIVFLLCVIYVSIIYRRLIISRGSASTSFH